MADRYYEHRWIKKDAIQARLYQESIAKTCLKRSTLVVLPTGLGKTVIALFVIAEKIQEAKGKILFLAPTKPLVQQHYNFLKENVLIHDIAMFTGEVSPKARADLWKQNTIIISTPQVIQNDLISGKFNLRDTSLIIFDEAHRAVGDYAYTFIGQRYNVEGTDPLALGITASPGNQKAHIIEVCKNLGIEGVEIRSEYDPDVLRYVHEIKVDWVPVAISPGTTRVISLFQGILKVKLNELRRMGLVPRKQNITTREILAVQGIIQGRLKSEGSKAPRSLYHAATVQAQAMKINHAIELLETQGLDSVRNYLERLENEAGSRSGSKAAKEIVSDKRYLEARKFLDKLEEEHPKLEYVKNIVKTEVERNPASKVIVFTHYRDTATLVTKGLEDMGLDRIRPIRFVGQASHGKDKGLSQKKQGELLDTFRSGENNVLIATSVAEEGLDIPATDLVIFYEPVPSEIRTIQRRGRTGRHSIGKVAILITRGTRDEAYYWSSKGKEKRMMKELRDLKDTLAKHLLVDDSYKTMKGLKVEPKEEPAGEGAKPKAGGGATPAEEKKEVTTTESTPDAFSSDPTEVSVDTSVPADSPSPEPTPTSPSTEPDGEAQAPQSQRLPTLEEVIKNGPAPIQEGQARLVDFNPGDDDKIKVIVDSREFRSQVVVELSNRGLVIEQTQLDVGDYVLSERCAVERKEVEDFLQSLIDKRLFQQVKRLASAYPRPLVLIEGDDLFTRRKISVEAIMGALAAITVSFKIPVITTKDAAETAAFLAVLAKKEYQSGTPMGTRGAKGYMSTKERQEFVIEGLPNISNKMAKRLLEHFGTIEALVAASEKEMTEVKGVGKTTAKELKEVLTAKYPKGGGED